MLPAGSGRGCQDAAPWERASLGHHARSASDRTPPQSASAGPHTRPATCLSWAWLPAVTAGCPVSTVACRQPVHDTARDSGDETEGANRSEPERASGPAVRLRRGVAREICKAARDTAEDVTAIVAWRR